MMNRIMAIGSRKRWRVILISLLLVCATFVHYMYYYPDHRVYKPSSGITYDSSSMKSGHDGSSDQASSSSSNRGCVMPILKEYNPVYASREKSVNMFKCRDEENWLIVSNGTVRFNPVIVKKYKGKIKCTINYLLRVTDFKQRIDTKNPHIFDAEKTSDGSFKLHHDFFQASCKSKQQSLLDPIYRYDNLHAGISVKNDVLKRSGEDLNTINDGAVVSNDVTSDGDDPNSTKAQATDDKLNILIFGFDSVSRVNFMRRLPKLYSYLTSELEGIVLKNYNVVGDGTTAAILGIFSGQYEDQLPETRRGKSHQTVDVYPFIWRQFNSKNYVTAYAEDESSIGTFQYRLNGFKDPPTDHFMRPFQLQAEHDSRKHHKYCLGSEPKINVLMGWLEQVFHVYPKNILKFVFGFHSEYSHGLVEELTFADDPVTQWIQHLHETNILNQTILMIMSDHGHRFSFTRSTLQGKYEERLPFFSVMLPKWFKTRYPNAYKSLKSNAENTLLTPFDIHATLEQILNHLNEKQEDTPVKHTKMTRGMSLFSEIPVERSCSDAEITAHWCACSEWVPVDDPSKDPMASRAVDSIITAINDLVKDSGQEDKCLKLQLKEITRVQKMIPKAELLKFKQSSDSDGRVADLSDTSTKVGLGFLTIFNDDNPLIDTCVNRDHDISSFEFLRAF